MTNLYNTEYNAFTYLYSQRLLSGCSELGSRIRRRIIRIDEIDPVSTELLP